MRAKTLLLYIFIIFYSLFFSLISSAQINIEAFYNLQKQLDIKVNNQSTGSYIKQYLTYKENENLFLENKLEGIYYQELSWLYSYLGDFRNALTNYDKQSEAEIKNYTTEDSLYLLNFELKDAVDVITNIADTVKIIMINEAHHIPEHRILTTFLLQKLYDKGYRYFCAEALNNSNSGRDTELNSRKYPVMSTGVYIAEPLYGDLIRQALKIGYIIVPYEISDTTKQSREDEQAKNIYKIFQNDSNAKVLVHCGYSHILKSWMAGRFKKISGIRPFTICQTKLMEYSKTGYCDKYYQLANKIFSFNKPSIPDSKQNNIIFKYNTFYDAVVIYPPTKYIYNRPEWMLMSGYRKLYLVHNSEIKDAFLVQAFSSEENDSIAVPIDQTLINPDGNTALFLPVGTYKIKFLNKNGNEIKTINNVLIQ